MIGENPIDKIADNVKEIAMEIFSWSQLGRPFD